MEVKIKKGVLHISHKIKRGEMYKVSKSKDRQSITFYKAPQTCSGFSSKTEDSQHILLLDYDAVEKFVVLDDIKVLQEEEGLSPAYLFTTNLSKENGEEVGNFHVVFLSKHYASEVYDLMKKTHIDPNFHDSPMRTKYRSWVLRIGQKVGSNKPKFLEIIDFCKSPISDWAISTAHKELLSRLYQKIKHPNYGKLEDGLKTIRIQAYETK